MPGNAAVRASGPLPRCSLDCQHGAVWATIRIDTPLGLFRAEVRSGDDHGSAEPRRSRLPSGAEVVVWPDVAGLVIDALVTPVIPFADQMTDMPHTHMWGIEWRLYSPIGTSELTVMAGLSDGAPAGSQSGDEHLVTLEHSIPEWFLAIGGPDEELLAQQADAGLQPASWRAAPSVSSESLHDIVWRLPPLRAGEMGRLHVAVAWCRAGHPRSDDAPWLAVDTSPTALRIAAGVPSPHEDRRLLRGT